MRTLLLHLIALSGRFFAARPQPGPLQRILVIKPDHMGDVLLVTPALHLLRQRFPQAHIVALVGPWSATILARNPAVDTLITLPFPGFVRGMARASLLTAPTRRLAILVLPYVVLVRYGLLLRAGRFDAALIMRDDHWWGAALALLAGIPLRAGFAVPECRRLLSLTLRWQPRQHVSSQALALVTALSRWGLPATGPAADAPQALAANGAGGADLRPENAALHFAPSAAERVWAADWLAQQGVDQRQRLVVLHAGTGGPAKLWSAARWAVLADQLALAPDVRLLLTGGPGEAALVAEIVNQMRQAPLQLVGTLRLGQLAALLAQADLALGVDSGPLHLAVSQGTPSLHLFGPSDPDRFGPWGDPARHRVIHAGLWCSPCGVFNACPRGTDPPECMQGIDVAQVLTAARELLTQS